MQRKRVLVALVAALALVWGTASLAAAPVKVTILVGFGTGTDPSQIEVHNKLRDQFNASHKDIQIDFLTVAYDQHDQKFTSLLAGGMAPDLVMPIGVMGIATYYDEWLDISKYIARDKYDMSDFYGPALEAHKYADKVLGLPVGVYPSVLFYNSDMFDRAKVAYPPHKFGATGWTYDQLVKVAQKLTVDKAGKTADQTGFDPANIVQYGYDGMDWSPWRTQPAKWGGNTLGMSADLKTAQMNAPEWRAAAQYLRDSIFTTHIRPKGAGENANAVYGDNDPIGSNKTGMWECFSWIQYNYTNWNSNFSWDVAAIPAGPKGHISAPANADTFAIPKASKHPDQAWEVAKWLLQSENMLTLTQSYGCIPARKSLAAGWLAGQKSISKTVDWQVFLDSINYMDKPNNEAWVPNYKKVWDAMENFQTGITTGKITDVNKASDDLNKEVQGYLNEYWKGKK